MRYSFFQVTNYDFWTNRIESQYRTDPHLSKKSRTGSGIFGSRSTTLLMLTMISLAVGARAGSRGHHSVRPPRGGPRGGQRVHFNRIHHGLSQGSYLVRKPYPFLPPTTEVGNIPPLIRYINIFSLRIFCLFLFLCFQSFFFLFYFPSFNTLHLKKYSLRGCPSLRWVWNVVSRSHRYFEVG